MEGMERKEQQYEAELAGMRAAIDEGDAGGVAEGNVFARVRETLALVRIQKWAAGCSARARVQRGTDRGAAARGGRGVWRLTGGHLPLAIGKLILLIR